MPSSRSREIKEGRTNLKTIDGMAFLNLFTILVSIDIIWNIWLFRSREHSKDRNSRASRDRDTERKDRIDSRDGRRGDYDRDHDRRHDRDRRPDRDRDRDYDRSRGYDSRRRERSRSRERRYYWMIGSLHNIASLLSSPFLFDWNVFTLSLTNPDICCKFQAPWEVLNADPWLKDFQVLWEDRVVICISESSH